MTEAEVQPQDWIRSWIERQREQIRTVIAAGEAATSLPNPLQDLVNRWFEASQAHVRGMAEFTQSAGAEGSTTPWDVLGRLPSLGLAREHAEAWRELADAQRECQELQQVLRSELARVQNDALTLLEQRTGERARDGKPVEAWRDLYDLWVECGEHVYSQVAHSEAYSQLQAQVGNATVRLRARQQALLERALKQFDLPTRSELNTVHRQIRELREKLVALEKRSRA